MPVLRWNSRQFLIAKGLRRDVLLAVLAKTQAKVPHRLYAVCQIANHVHLLIRPENAPQVPRLMHWVGWYSAMAFNRLAGRCGHFWEVRDYATAIAPSDNRRVLNTLRSIHANPKAAGVRKGFRTPSAITGTTAGWRLMASASVARLYCSWPQRFRAASGVMSGFTSSITIMPKVLPSATGTVGC